MPLKLYLVRHGEAKSKLEDPQRSLTERGKRETEHVASFVEQMKPRIYQIQHSGKKRAEETAAIFGAHLSPEAGIVTVSGLLPNDDVLPVAIMLKKETSPLMLVGHLPFLDRLVGYLVAENAEHCVVRFPASGTICLVQENGIWGVEWMVIPTMV